MPKRNAHTIFQDGESSESDVGIPLSMVTKATASPAQPSASKKARKSSSDSGDKDKGKSQTTGGDQYLSLGNMRRLTVSDFKGEMRIDIREFYADKDSGEEKPGKKGISLSAAQWDMLKTNIHLVDKMVKDKKKKQGM
ncbi:uncharacterized protein EHS24_007732 [Apiotrichum porosum]|uniref:Transcriptional coactivator p15 (PC4) C-terminal domain-containing protein n=1 Tax=Apiotrichum porosum TaxID=105984 RepID=A0A427XV26_9TREE|nr:uncharacterized protein EHS24_007732 [Apiotrichum porosum]RSH82738.1 hypothetical protein EHS24_007732 [Apiotrichum porosum]